MGLGHPPEGLGILAQNDNFLGRKPMLKRIATHDVLAVGRSGTRAFLGVPTIGFDAFLRNRRSAAASADMTDSLFYQAPQQQSPSRLRFRAQRPAGRSNHRARCDPRRVGDRGQINPVIALIGIMRRVTAIHADIRHHFSCISRITLRIGDKAGQTAATMRRPCTRPPLASRHPALGLKSDRRFFSSVSPTGPRVRNRS